MPERESVTWGHAKRGEHCLQTFEKKGIKFLGGGNCNQGLWNPNWQDMDLQSFVLKKDGGYFQVTLIFNPYWQSLENSSKNFSEISVFLS